MNRIKELRARLAELRAEVVQYRRDDDAEPLDDADSQKFDDALKEYDTANRQLRLAELEAENAELRDSERSTIPMPGGSTRAPRSEWRNARGDVVHCLGRDERLSDQFDGDNQFSLGRAVVNALTNREQDQRDAHGLLGSAGGLLLEPQAAAGVLDSVRAESVAFRAGARLVAMETAELKLARVETAPSPSWTAELKSVSDGTQTFAATTLRARTLRVPIEISEELLADAPNAAAAIERELVLALASGLDDAILFGGSDGTEAESPVGVLNTSGVGTVTSAGSPTNYDEVLDSITVLENANSPGPYAVVSNPRLYQSLRKLKSGITNDEQTLIPPPEWNDLARFAKTTMSIVEGGGSDEGSAIYGPFSWVWVGMRLSAQILIVPVDANTYSRRILGVLRADVGIPRPEYFCVESGILA